MLVLPYQSLSWSQVTPPAGVDFGRYVIYRDGEKLIAPVGPLAELETASTVAYRDYLAAPGVAHSYAVAWVGEQGGVELESAASSPVVTTGLEFLGAWIHDPEEPDEQLNLLLRSYDFSIEQEATRLRARRRPSSTRFSSAKFERVVRVEAVPDHLFTDTRSHDLEGLARRQTAPTSATYALRVSSEPETLFVAADDVSHVVAATLMRGTATFREVFYREVES